MLLWACQNKRRGILNCGECLRYDSARPRVEPQKGGRLRVPFSVVSCVLFLWNMSCTVVMFHKNKTQETTENGLGPSPFKTGRAGERQGRKEATEEDISGAHVQEQGETFFFSSEKSSDRLLFKLKLPSGPMSVYSFLMNSRRSQRSPLVLYFKNLCGSEVLTSCRVADSSDATVIIIVLTTSNKGEASEYPTSDFQTSCARYSLAINYPRALMFNFKAHKKIKSQLRSQKENGSLEKSEYTKFHADHATSDKREGALHVESKDTKEAHDYTNGKNPGQRVAVEFCNLARKGNRYPDGDFLGYCPTFHRSTSRLRNVGIQPRDPKPKMGILMLIPLSSIPSPTMLLIDRTAKFKLPIYMDHLIAIFVLFGRINFTNALGQEGEALSDEWGSLAEMPLDKLLHVKKALESNIGLEDLDDGEDGVERDREDLGVPMRERKKKKKKYKDGHWRREHLQDPPIRRDSWEVDAPWQSSKGKGDIGSIFHGTITVLAFLAFGGYLLCLLLQAVKGYPGYVYPTTTTPPTTTTTATTSSAGRRRKRRSDPPPFSSSPPRDGAELDRIFQTMVTIAESYAKYEKLNRNNN
ncbi:hypothetical protein AAG570_011481 [Ranatra chinensis]|uniref:Uncharacterized protein n=1 Tax=Ranatra chinensis TaxID=642074 RepID=A0ABD0YKR9_9HEMI